MSIDEEWSNFLDNSEDINITKPENRYCNDSSLIPKCSDIYISTKTKIIYLNKELLDIYSIFWKIKIEDYDKQVEGIIKKQIKISCNTKEESETLENLIKNESYYVSTIINHVDNPNGRIKFKDVRKISVGLCKKDLINTRTKKKSAFYNCFVVTLRVLYNGLFKEIHVKIFNTGKLEIPGIQNDKILEIVLIDIVKILEEILNDKLEILYDKTENVLINSNFNCGFYIDREILFNLLRYKYRINASYDPCSYPGIQCVYYYDYLNKVGISSTLNLDSNMKKDKNIQKISYMIFRTGSILIVGKCSEDVLKIVYEYVKNILISEYKEIMTKIIDKSLEKQQKQPSKTRKRMIYIK
jgi:hypothetical protein|tara:strand:+ start:611 stop:1675 length:1065 start_codon:yes stop_codon:yes gene_type:complete